MIESRPVEITFDAVQEISGLKVVSSLHAANGFGEAAVEVVAGNIQIATGPGAAEVPTDIKS